MLFEDNSPRMAPRSGWRVFPLGSSVGFMRLITLLTAVVVRPLAATGITAENASNSAKLKEYCQWQSLNATCAPDQVILMEHAHYGRMKLGTCLTSDYKIGCYADILMSADSRCSGRQQCLIDIPDEDLHQQSPCPPDMMTYLEASYQCVTVGSPTPDVTSKQCAKNKRYVLPPIVDTGYISNGGGSGSNGAGSASCPWVLQVLPGQRINLTLYDFMVAERYKTGAAHTQRGGASGERGERFCQVYAMVHDSFAERETAVCGSTYRQTAVYTSKSNRLELSIMATGAPDTPLHFLFKYQAVGCPDLEPPVGAWFSRDMERGVIRCNFTSQTWHLVCRDNQWVGTFSNCTLESAAGLGKEDEMPTYGLVAAVIIGCILGIFLGMCLLGIVLLCRRKKRRVPKYFADNRPLGCEGEDPYQTTGMYTKQPPDMLPRSPVCGGGGAGGTTPRRARAQTHHLPPEHSHYTHVWELRSAPAKPLGSGTTTTPTTTKLAGIHKEKPLALRSFLGHGHGQRGGKDQHIYESPKFDRCPGCPHPTLPRDPRDPAFFHLAHPTHATHHPVAQTPMDHMHANSKQQQQHPGVVTSPTPNYPQNPPDLGMGAGHVSPSHMVPSSPTGHVTNTNNPAPFKTDDVIMTSDDSDDDVGRCEIRFSKGVGYRPVPLGGSTENHPNTIKAT